MSEPKSIPEIIDHIDALFAKATPGDWERDLHDTHSAEATFAYVMGPDAKHLFGAENSDVIEIHNDGAGYWDETGKRNLDLVCALKNSWEQISAELKRIVDATEIVDAINKLRTEEGQSVEIVHDNADFGGPNCAITWCSGTGDFVGTTFYGDTVADALKAALNAQAEKAKV